MPPKRQKNTRPVVALRYWTAEAAGSATIAKWLADELEGNRLAFYASFNNWSLRQVQRVKNPTKWAVEELKERANNVLLVLQTQPLNARAYIRLMHDYRKHDYASGCAEGHIVKPENAG